MLKITTVRDNDQTLRVRACGELTAEYIPALEQALTSAAPETCTIILDLQNVTLVDRDVMEFLCAARSRNIAIENVPSYVIRWIEQERRCSDAPSS